MDVIITFDLDHVNCNNKFYEKAISFDYKNALKDLTDYFQSQSIKNFTAFVRIDKQIENLFGDYLYVFKLLPNGLQSEVAWHPHLFGDPVPELWNIYMSTHVVRECKSVRIGGCQMDLEIMSALANMNFQIDSTALPGCSRNDEHRKFDWSLTGNTYYNPCVHDYMCPGSFHHNILEIPMTTMLTLAPYDLKPKKRYINPTIRKEIFQPAFSFALNYFSYIVIVFHPDELIEGYEDDLYLYGMKNFEENMNFIKTKIGSPSYKSLYQLRNSIYG